MMRSDQPKTIFLKDYQAPAYWIDNTDLIFEIGEESTKVKSRLFMRKNKMQSPAPLVLHGQQLQLTAIMIDGFELKPESYSVDSESLTIHSDLKDEFTLYCETIIKPQENTSLEGLYKSGGMFCTQCEAEGFRKITYYLDRPDVMAKFTTTIIADKKRYPILLSNGNETVRADIGDELHCVTWEDPFKKPAYLFALVAGDLVFKEDSFTTMSGRKVVLRIFVEAFNADKCAYALESLKKSMKWDEEVFGREYDLDIFMIVAVDHFNMGAMENKGLNIFNSSCVLAKPETTTDEGFDRIESIVAHEYFHNWSGNRVSCRDWFQLSLKEGFTVFRDQQFSSDMNSATVERISEVGCLRTAQFAEDAGPMAHPVRPDSYIEISNFYTLTVYEKGAELVRMLYTLLGKELFRKATDYYFKTYDGQAVTTDDFVQAMEKASGRDLTQFRLWYQQAGTPVLTITDAYDEKSQRYTLTIKQSCPSTPKQNEKLPLHIPVTVGLLSAQGKSFPLQLAGEAETLSTERVLELTQSEHTFIFENINRKPIPSLLRHFSAPVKLHFNYNNDDLLFLMKRDTDGFNRWDAGQRLVMMMFNDLITAYQQQKPVTVNPSVIDAYRQLLTQVMQENADYALIAKMLTLPSQTYLHELAEVIDVEAIHHVHEQVKTIIAGQLKNELIAVYQHLAFSNTDYYDGKVSAARTLKNTCLAYLATPDDADGIALCETQFATAKNMSDSKAALTALINNPNKTIDKENLLSGFYERWKGDVLVSEQWFALQSMSFTCDVAAAKKLLNHPAFALNNPNIIRAVIGVFANYNHIHFHDVSGAGYEFLADQVLIIDKLNPQIAARLLIPLTRWRKHNSQRQQCMKKALTRILQKESLSKDAYEIASKGLAE